MWTSTSLPARILLTFAVSGLISSVSGADAKPDKKRSQAEYQRGLRADEAGHRDQAISAYSEAIQADAGNAAAWRARGKDYLVAGDSDKAAADIEQVFDSFGNRPDTGLVLPPDVFTSTKVNLDLIALDDAMKELASFDPRQCKIVELRFFGGLSIEETADVVEISPATAKREWACARLWLHRAINHGI